MQYLNDVKDDTLINKMRELLNSKDGIKVNTLNQHFENNTHSTNTAQKNQQHLLENIKIKIYCQYPPKGNYGTFLHFQIFVYTNNFRDIPEIKSIDLFSWGNTKWEEISTEMIDYYTISILIKNPVFKVLCINVRYRTVLNFSKYGSII